MTDRLPLHASGPAQAVAAGSARLAPDLLRWLPAILAASALLLIALRLHLGWQEVVTCEAAPDPASGHASGACSLARLTFASALLPRLAIGLVAGAALGLSGLLLQRVLRNPLAEPATLGITAGAQLALAIATLFLPALLTLGREPVALLGGLGTVALLLSLTWRKGLDPVSVVLGGMMLTMMAVAASAALIIFNGDYVFSLFVWGGGSLVQQDWQATGILGTLTLAVALCAVLLRRPLTLLSLDDRAARGLGLAVTTLRIVLLAMATGLASAVTAHLGPIAFIGLGGPALARIAATGASGTASGTSSGGQTLSALVISATLLSVTDSALALTIGREFDRIPAGAAAALLGGPLLLWVLPRLSMLRPGERRDTGSLPPAPTGPLQQSPARLALLALGLVLACSLALCLGRNGQGWQLVTGADLADMLPWRLPRILTALAGGALLATAGVILQKLSGNPLAGPEILGVGAASGVGLCLMLLIVPLAGSELRLAASTTGALLATLLILRLATRAGFSRERLLLGGVALGAFCSAILSAVMAMGSPVSYQLVAWMTGSTQSATLAGGLALTGSALGLVALLLGLGRWLDLLSLGDPLARALGLPLRPARLTLIALSAAATALATLSIGPLSFIGLVAPHLARLGGFAHGRAHVIASTLCGGMLLVISDWLSRQLAFPYQLPLGLIASLLAGPYLLWLLGNGRSRLH